MWLMVWTTATLSQWMATRFTDHPAPQTFTWTMTVRNSFWWIGKSEDCKYDGNFLDQNSPNDSFQAPAPERVASPRTLQATVWWRMSSVPLKTSRNIFHHRRSFLASSDSFFFYFWDFNYFCLLIILATKHLENLTTLLTHMSCPCKDCSSSLDATVLFYQLLTVIFSSNLLLSPTRITISMVSNSMPRNSIFVDGGEAFFSDSTMPRSESNCPRWLKAAQAFSPLSAQAKSSM